MEIIDRLKQPFEEKDIEWRVQQAKKNGDNLYCLVLCYVQARAIEERLDSIFGFDGWSAEYRNGNSDNNIICRLGVRVDNTWIYKENGASETNVEPFKGGISGAFKRVASSGFGIGRYLYKLDATFANVSLTKKQGWNKASIKEGNNYINYWWETPKLPEWALPDYKAPNNTNNELMELTNKYDGLENPDSDAFNAILEDGKKVLDDYSYKLLQAYSSYRWFQVNK